MKVETIMQRIVYRNGDDKRACRSYTPAQDTGLGIAPKALLHILLQELETDGMLRYIPYSHPVKYKVTDKGMELAKEARSKAVARANRPWKSAPTEETSGATQNCACPDLTPSRESAIVDHRKATPPKPPT